MISEGVCASRIEPGRQRAIERIAGMSMKIDIGIIRNNNSREELISIPTKSCTVHYLGR